MAVALEPPSLTTLAEHLRDGTLLDMRVIDLGTCERVEITELRILREKDIVVAEQRWWIEHQGHDELEVRTADLTFDAEDIRWLRETTVDECDVKPVAPLANDPVVPMTYATEPLIAAIVQTISFIHQVPESVLRFKESPREPYARTRARQIAMWLTYEMTPLKPNHIATKDFGFHSVQPMLTICRLAQGDGKFRRELRQGAAAVESKIGGRPRRPHAFNRNPDWTLIL